MKKKLVLMIPQMRNGGAERVVSRLSFLLKDKYDVRIVVFDNEAVTYEVGCEIYSLNIKPNPKSSIFSKFFNVIKRVYLLNKYKKDNEIDITYSFGDTANLVNILSSSNKKIISIRGFKRVRLEKTLKNKLLYKPLLKYIFNKADKIVCVSKLMSKTIIEEFEISNNKVTTSYNGYDVENIFNMSKEKLSVDYFSQNLIVSAGTFRSEKGYWHLIKAFSLVEKNKKGIKLLILGEDYLNNKNKVEKLVSDLGLVDKVIYAGYQSNPYKFFAASSIYVLSSTSEGFPNAMVEAMGCGLPIIASDCKSGPREIIAPNTEITREAEKIEMAEYGILVKEMNREENYISTSIEECDEYLANAILTLLNDEELRLKYASYSKVRANQFGYSKWLENQLEIIES